MIQGLVSIMYHSNEGVPVYIIINSYGFSSLFIDIDIDECARGTDKCHVNATCMDADGLFLCTCLEGFRGNGIICGGMKHPYGITSIMSPGVFM